MSLQHDMWYGLRNGIIMRDVIYAFAKTFFWVELISLSHSAYIISRIIMTFRRSCRPRVSTNRFYLLPNINVEQKFVNSWLKFKILQIIKELVIPYANKAFFNLGKIVSTIICPCPLLPFVQDVHRFFLVFKHMTFKVWSRQKGSLFIVIFLLTGTHGSLWQSVKSSYCYNVKKFDEFFVVY